MTSRTVPRTLLTAAGLTLALGGAVHANTPSGPDEERVQVLEERVDILTEEIANLRLANVSSQLGESYGGLGKAASKIFNAASGLSIGGYGEVIYQNFRSNSMTDSADFLRVILYVGYKFNDKWVLNTEIEIEHADEIFLEFATLDYLHSRELNGRVGLLLIPMGFVNELHEPTTFLSVRRPDVETFIIPSTWRENGVGVYGECDQFSYKLYLVNGFDGQDYRASDGLRAGRQKGSRAEANDFAGVARLDFIGLPGVVVGGSYYLGHSAQDLAGADGETRIVEAHAEWKYRGVHVRGLWADATVDDVGAMATAAGLAATDAIGENLQGGYVELGYDLFATCDTDASLTPFARWESYDLQRDVPAGFMETGSRDVTVTTFGLAWQPIANLIFKADFQNYNTAAGDGTNQFNLGMGYIF